MNGKNITPAVNLEDQGPNELSAEEFQRRLYMWFEDRGLVSDMRAHLRMQMINILKDTAIGKTVSSQLRQPITPKAQAINLLIAEFLLNQDCYYTLSMFSTEAPMINVLPEFSDRTMAGTSQEHKKWRFTEKDMWDILETLGIEKNSAEGALLATRYYEDSNLESLLTCILREMHKNLRTKKSDTEIKPSCSMIDKTAGNKFTVNITDSKTLLNDINDVFSKCGLHETLKLQMLEKLAFILNTERDHRIKEQKEAFKRLEVKLNEKARHYEEEYKKKLEKLSRTFDNEQKKYQEEHKQKQLQLDTYSETIQRQNKQIRNHLNDIISRDKSLDQREQMLDRQQQELEQREKILQSDYSCLYDEKRAISQLQIQLKENVQNLEAECGKSNKQVISENVMTDDKENADSAQQTLENRRDMEEALLKGMVRQMQLENAHLRNVNNEQMLRIQELSQRASLLIRELENSQGRMPGLGLVNQHSSSAGILSGTVIASPTRNRNGAVSFNGSGEEGIRVLPTPPPRQFRNLSHRDSRRKLNARRIAPVPSTSSSEDPTPTEEVLMETRARLRSLERESEEIDKNFQKYHKSRQGEKKCGYSGSDLPRTSFLKSCRQSLFDITDYNYQEQKHKKNSNRNAQDLQKEIPGTSQGIINFDFSKYKVKTDDGYVFDFVNTGPKADKPHPFNFDMPREDGFNWKEAFGKFKLNDGENKENASGQSPESSGPLNLPETSGLSMSMERVSSDVSIEQNEQEKD